MRGIFRTLLSLGVFGSLVWLEQRHPLRENKRESKLRRNARNLTVAALAAVTIHLVERPIVQPLAKIVQRRGWGMLKQIRVPVWLETLLAVALLDYTLFVWHILTHRIPFLWRFHSVHHVDLDNVDRAAPAGKRVRCESLFHFFPAAVDEDACRPARSGRPVGRRSR